MVSFRKIERLTNKIDCLRNEKITEKNEQFEIDQTTERIFTFLLKECFFGMNF